MRDHILRSTTLRRLLLGLFITGLQLFLGGTAESLAAEAPHWQTMEKSFQRQLQPLMQKYCLKCHSTEAQEGQLDLERFAKLGDVRKDPAPWQKVAEMLDAREMPPKRSEQMSAVEQQVFRKWVGDFLKQQALDTAGDPGPVLLRRLSNAEYTFTLQDLTGVDLKPARDFPADGAAGEGFTNTGNALVMSPALFVKYLDAAKEIARHAVLLPEGFRFSTSESRRDWTNETLASIRQFYARYADAEGKIPLQTYLQALLQEQEALRAGKTTPAAVAATHRLNPRYLQTLWTLLNNDQRSILFDQLRHRFRSGSPADAQAIAGMIQAWQNRLTRFQPVGHMKSWMVAANPLTFRQDFRLPIPEQLEGTEVTLSLALSTAGDGQQADIVEWQAPRLVIPGRAPLYLKDLRQFMTGLDARRKQVFAETAAALAAAADVARRNAPPVIADLSKKHQVSPMALTAWLGYLGLQQDSQVRLNTFTERQPRVGGYDFVKGWGSPETPFLIANSSDQAVRVPGAMKPHGVCVHPSPILNACAGWRSPVSGTVKVTSIVTRAHPECGNGVTWAVELRRGLTRQKLASGDATGRAPVRFETSQPLAVQKGDVVSLVIGPREGSHACDLTDIELNIEQQDGDRRTWNLNRDVSSDLHASNPHADRHGNAEVWNFYSEPTNGDPGSVNLPPNSLLARWLAVELPAEQAKLAAELQALLSGPLPKDPRSPDTLLYRRLHSLLGPIYFAPSTPDSQASPSNWGLDPAQFGKFTEGTPVDPRSLCVQAPQSIQVKLPADLIAGCEFLTTAFLHPQIGKNGSVQPQVALRPLNADTNLRDDLPLLVISGSETHARIERDLESFRQVFPAALCYTRIVPVDEAVTLTLYHREDEPFQRLMLSDSERQQLDRLWHEMHFVAQDALTLVDAFQQLMEYATQDGDPRLFEPYRKPIYDRAAAYKQELLDTEPNQLQRLVEFASLAYRRPLADGESAELRRLYTTFRGDGLSHEEAWRLLLARILSSPHFLYRLEHSPAGTASAPVNDWELATRLSYFLWASAPDAELRQAAAEHRLHDPDVLVTQARRMLKRPQVRRLSSEFACQWLHIYEFNTLDEKSERHFPTFTQLRGDMYEEAIRFFTELFQSDASLLSIYTADHIIVNEALAKHYGIPGVTGTDWKRVPQAAAYGRGGILGLSATLAKQSGASRTSPILRGNWVSEVLLGERLPRPPKNVPVLPEDETATAGLTVRQLVEKHTNDPRCSSCHVRVDPFGYSLEAYDAIGQFRQKDLAGRPIDTMTKVMDGTELNGMADLRDYLVNTRRDTVVRQFCKKLTGYALGRSVQLSDEPLLQEMQQKLKQNDYRFFTVIECLLRSRQFREIREKSSNIADLN